MTFDLKRLPKEGIPAALEKTKRYRLLNMGAEAESICLDILAVEPENQEALVMLILALTDQFVDGIGKRERRARELLPRLEDEYEQAYYAGIIEERRAKAQLKREYPGAGYAAYEGLTKAMEWFDKAESLAQHGTDQAILRWNSCARIMNNNRSVQPTPAESPRMLE